MHEHSKFYWNDQQRMFGVCFKRLLKNVRNILRTIARMQTTFFFFFFSKKRRGTILDLTCECFPIRLANMNSRPFPLVFLAYLRLWERRERKKEEEGTFGGFDLSKLGGFLPKGNLTFNLLFFSCAIYYLNTRYDMLSCLIK